MSEQPSAQAVTAWKKKADKLVEVRRERKQAEAELEEKLSPIRAEHEPNIEKLKTTEGELESAVVSFGTEHKGFLFADVATIKTKLAKICAKVTAGTVVVSDGLEKKDVLEAMTKTQRLKKFLRITPALDATKTKRAFTDGSATDRDALEGVGLEYKPGYSVTVTAKES